MTRLPGRSSLPALAALAGAGILVQGATRFVYTMLVIRLTASDVVADFAESLALASFLTLLLPAGASMTASRFTAAMRGADDDDGRRQVAAYLARLTLVGGAALCVTAALYGALVLDLGGLEVGSVVVLTGALAGYQVVKGLRYGHAHVGRATAWEAVAAGVSLSAVLAVLLTGADAVVALPLALGYLVFAVAGWPRDRSAPRDRALQHRLRGFTAWASLATLASGGMIQLALLMAGRWADRREVALLAAAVFLATPATMLASALAQVLSPAIAHGIASDQRDRVRSQVDLATRALIIVLIGALGGVAVLAPVLLRVVYGADYVAAQHLLAIIAVAVSLVSVANAAIALLIGGATTGMRGVAFVQLGATLVGLVVIVGTAPWLGVLGVAAGVLVGSAVNGLTLLAYVWRRERMAWTGLAVRVAGGLAVLGATVAAVQSMDASTATVVAAAGGWAVVWLGLSWRDVRLLTPSRSRARGVERWS